MSVSVKFVSLSPEEYLEFEEKSARKHEYIAGHIFAMAGASDAHNLITGNIYALLRSHVRGTGCRVYMADMKLRVEEADVFYYPDVMVTREPFEAKSVFKSSPCLLVEVLSPSTASTDRREKLTTYRHLKSLRDYVVVYQDQARVEVYRKDEKGNWQLAVLGDQDVLFLDSFPHASLTITMAEIYEDVIFATE